MHSTKTGIACKVTIALGTAVKVKPGTRILLPGCRTAGDEG